MAKITYGKDIAPISKESTGVLSHILDACGIPSAVISSTKRTPGELARIMFDNLVKYGIEAQKALYGPVGDLVIDVYVTCTKAGLIPAQVKQLMQEKIEALGPGNVSRHCSDDPTLDVFDVAPSSIPENKRTIFEEHIKDCPLVQKFIPPPLDPGYHIQMRKGA